MVAALLTLAAWTPKPFSIEGVFVEGCSCLGTCTFETAGANPGCRAIGAYRISKGAYAGKSLAGIGVAFVVDANGQVFTYVDAPSGPLRSGGEAFCQAAFKDFGTNLSVGFQSVKITGTAGAFLVQVGPGTVAELKTSPILGGDGKSPVELRNVHGSLYRSLFQAKVVAGSFKVNGHTFSLKGTSAFYNPHAAASGSL